MKKALNVLIAATVLLLVSNISFAINRELIGEVKAESVNFNTNKVIKDTVELYVYTNSSISLISCKSLILSKVNISSKRTNDFIALLNKGLKWSEQARKLKVNIAKKIGSINEYGWDTSVLVVRFISVKKGKDTGIALMFYTTGALTCVVRLNDNQVSGLLKLAQEKKTVAYKRLKQAKRIEGYFK